MVEHQVATRLRERGYLVIKSGGSRGPYDLVAIKDRMILGVQVKRGEGYEWTNPISPFCCFVPILIHRFRGGWSVLQVTATTYEK